jgi:hypothetical protein
MCFSISAFAGGPWQDAAGCYILLRGQTFFKYCSFQNAALSNLNIIIKIISYTILKFTKVSSILYLQLFSYIVILPNLMDTDELDPLVDIYFLALCASLFYTTLCIHISKFGSEDYKKIKGTRPCKLHPDEIR